MRFLGELFRQKVPQTLFSENFLGKKFSEPFKNLLGKEGFYFLRLTDCAV